MRVLVNFRQECGVFSVSKEIEFVTAPVPGVLFDYEDGFDSAHIKPYGERGMWVSLSRARVEIDGYGPQFTDEEITRLKDLGWRDSRDE
jgi:hypothetical protein